MGLPISNGKRIFEIGAVVITACGKFLFFDILNAQFWYILIVCLFWVGFSVFRYWQNENVLKYWGFKKEGSKESLKVILPLSIFAVLLFYLYGTLKDGLILNWHIFPTLLLYPIWGIVQQFLILGLVAGNLHDFSGVKIPKSVIILLTSILFAVIHYPFYMLIWGTFALALCYTWIYLQYRNLWVLGIFHGWLGCFYFFFVMERDPWLVFINSI